MAWRQILTCRLPILTLFIVGSALVVYGLPVLGDVLVYDRQAILAGQWWRVASAPLVHFSLSHLGWDVLVFAVAGSAIEVGRYRYFWLVCVIASVLPGLVYLVTTPQLAFYGGLSGLATGAVAYLCLCELCKKGNSRILWLIIMLLLGGKILLEAVAGEALFMRAGPMPVRVLPLVHLTGVLAAGAAWLCGVACRDMERVLEYKIR